jgi:hypothetical protein
VEISVSKPRTRTHQDAPEKPLAPLHGGGQGFESPRLHSEKTLICRQNKGPEVGLECTMGPLYCNRTATRYRSTSSRACVALSCMFGSTWEYVSRVIAIVAWPSISETILGLTFLARSSVAQVWRRSWKRIRGSWALLSSGAKDRFLRLEGFTSVPFSVAKTRRQSS